jgi:hypothetical protein
MRRKKIGWNVVLSILVFIIIIPIIFYSVQQNTHLSQISYADQLICPTPDAGAKTLQVKSCYVITSTPMPGQPSAGTVTPGQNATPVPTSNITPTPTKKVPPPTGQHTLCKGTIVSFGIQKTLIPIRPWHGRPGDCIVPKTIVLHITAASGTPENIRDYFASGSNGRGSSVQFIIGRDGRGLQIVETLVGKVEIAYGVGGYLDDISIEMISPIAFHRKSDEPKAEYDTTITLVRKLMAQYNIPLGNLQWNWQDFNHPLGDPNLPKGVYAHYQLNPFVRTDPGSGWFCDFRNDLGAHAKCNYNVLL